MTSQLLELTRAIPDWRASLYQHQLNSIETGLQGSEWLAWKLGYIMMGALRLAIRFDELANYPACREYDARANLGRLLCRLTKIRQLISLRRTDDQRQGLTEAHGCMKLLRSRLDRLDTGRRLSAQSGASRDASAPSLAVRAYRSSGELRLNAFQRLNQVGLEDRVVLADLPLRISSTRR